MNQEIIFKTIVGSQAYGTSTITSDVDIKGVYIQSTDEILSFGYKEQIDIGKDETYYEVRRFIQLLQSANPTMLEMLYMPDEFVEINSPQFDLIKQHRDMFLTKKCLHSFGGYAIAQIKKAKGLDKKMNWEKDKVIRKTPVDFIYTYDNGHTLPIERWLKQNKLNPDHCGLVALNHFKDCYSLYYDYKAKYQENLGNRSESYTELKFKGISLEDSNSIRLSSVPKEMNPEAIIFYNKDGYSQHCKEFKEYTEWLEKRNTSRYVDIGNHGQKIDGKNMLHCRRLLDTAMEIVNLKTINVTRPNADYLLQIRRGEVDLNTIIIQAERDIKMLDQLYSESDLPDNIDFNFANQLLLKIRKLNPNN